MMGHLAGRGGKLRREKKNLEKGFFGVLGVSKKAKQKLDYAVDKRAPMTIANTHWEGAWGSTV